MAADDPREPRFEPIMQGRPAPSEPLRIDPTEIRTEPQPSAAGEATASMRWLLIGIAAAVILVVVIIVASRHAATPPAPTPPAPVASNTLTTTPAPESASMPSATPAGSATPQTTTTSTADWTNPPPQTVSTPTPRPAPVPHKSSPPIHGQPSEPAVTLPPASPGAVAPAPTPVSAPRKAPLVAAGSAASAVSAHGPKHRRRGPSEAAPWLVQVGAFKEPGAAEAVVSRLTKDGWSARSAKGVGGWTVAEVTGYRTREEATHAAKLLAAKAHVPTLVRHVTVAPKTTPSAPAAASRHHPTSPSHVR